MRRTGGILESRCAAVETRGEDGGDGMYSGTGFRYAMSLLIGMNDGKERAVRVHTCVL